MRKKLARNLWIITLILIAFGLLALISASSVQGQEKYNDPLYFVKKQITRGLLLGLILAFLASKIDLYFLKKISSFLLIFNIILLLLCFIPQFSYTNETMARRWLRIGGFSFQPSELLKITYPLFLASILSSASLRQRRKILGKPFIYFLLSLSIIGLIIIKQPATGSLTVLGLSSLAMYLSASMSWLQFLLTSGLGALTLFYYIMKTPYRKERIFSFLSPEKDPLGTGYHIIQSLTGIGLGGLLGVGFGNSIQKFNYLPESHTDAIFSIIAEEFGFIGSLALLILFIVFVWIGIKISQKSHDKFLKYLALGLTCNIGFEAFVNIAAMCQLLPMTGIPLPFISYGGSAMIINLISVGFLTNIALKD